MKGWRGLGHRKWGHRWGCRAVASHSLCVLLSRRRGRLSLLLSFPNLEHFARILIPLVLDSRLLYLLIWNRNFAVIPYYSNLNGIFVRLHAKLFIKRHAHYLDSRSNDARSITERAYVSMLID
jgi:hypothetical protein